MPSLSADVSNFPTVSHAHRASSAASGPTGRAGARAPSRAVVASNLESDRALAVLQAKVAVSAAMKMCLPVTRKLVRPGPPGSRGPRAQLRAVVVSNVEPDSASMAVLTIVREMLPKSELVRLTLVRGGVIGVCGPLVPLAAAAVRQRSAESA